MRRYINIKSFILITLISISTAFSSMLFAQCSQNNIVVTGYQLRNNLGQVFSVTDNYELGQPISGELWVNFGGSTTNGYNLTMYYDVFINGAQSANDQVDCMYSGTQIQQNVWTKVRNISWNWGDVVQIRDIFMYWETGSAKANTTCNIVLKNNVNAQCYSNPLGFTAAVPLFPKFDFASNGICNTTIQFTSETIGGTPPFNYSFSWDFNNDGTIDSNSANPLYNFPSTGTYAIRMTVNDGTSITTITKNIFIDPNFGIQVNIFPTKVNENTGIIYVQSVTGGTAPYSYSWIGPNGFTSTSKDIYNLSDGLYRLTVTDLNGCTQTVEYIMDIASVLEISWKAIEVKESNAKVGINWEMNSEKEGSVYLIERSFGNADNFREIGEVSGQGNSQDPVNYSYTDESFPVFENLIYYRIVHLSGESKTYSEVKVVKRVPENKMEGNWIVYPNPSRDGNIKLKFINGQIPFGEKIQIQAINGGNYVKNIEVVVGNEDAFMIDQLIGALPSGLTLLRVQWQNHSESFKLIRSE